MRFLRMYIGLIILFSVSMNAVEASDGVLLKEEVIEKFVLGNQAYKEGNYDLAINEYEMVAKGQKESGEIYYNLANAYFKKGQLGYAILNYEKAKQFIPRDSDLNFNLNYAKSLMKRTTNGTEENVVTKLIDGHINFYTLDEMVIIMTCLVVLLGIFIFLSRLFKWNFVFKSFSRMVFLTILIIYALGFYFKIQDVTNKAIMVQSSAANFEPNEKATSHFELQEGMPVKIVKQKDGWVKIRRNDGRLGWVQSIKLQQI